MARSGRRELDEVEADAPPVARRHRQGEEEAGRWEMVGFEALACRACPDVLLHGSGQAGTTRRGESVRASCRARSARSEAWNEAPAVPVDGASDRIL